ncbi:LrgB family protein [Conservatibacter flavescens]|uniref:CidB/LrgB family autolysis modulator n=1 Tax=Conservatibacter flavescens TaxID=28161 RepID=A0A2M8S626_9PAST|nr:LrgB family protein [Conservatibacter flavescens]PJG86563.1 CidB/LrgB family autolysis modulator [Conservatibacter flavescens]
MTSEIWIYGYSLLTIGVFVFALQIGKYWRSLVFNAFVLSVIALVVILLCADLPYEQYIRGNAPLNHLLPLGIVALALPLYEQLAQIRKQWREILFITTTASLFSMLTGGILAVILGATPDIAATLLSKSVTMPIAMAMTENMGGVPAIAAIGVMLAGLQGSIFGYVILKKCHIRYRESIGLSIGAVSHVLGTAAMMQQDTKIGTYSSLALVLCGIVSSLFAPMVFKLVYFLF